MPTPTAKRQITRVFSVAFNSRVGWALGAGGQLLDSGLWAPPNECRTVAQEAECAAEFAVWLRGRFGSFDRIDFGLSGNETRLTRTLRGVLLALASAHGIEPHEHKTGLMKHAATGNGQCTAEELVASAIKWWSGADVTHHAHAAALWFLDGAMNATCQPSTRCA